MHLTPREFDKLLIYMLAEVALKRKQQGLKLNHSTRWWPAPPRTTWRPT